MTDGDTRGLQVVLVDAHGLPIRARGLTGWLRRVAPARTRGLVAVALVSDEALRRMNRQFLGKNRPTDVLSFPAWPADARSAKAARGAGHVGQAARATAGKPASAGQGFRRRAEARPGEGGSPARQRVLGDIAIATGVALRQAREAGHSYSQELRVLALHGLLHLLGYDHDRDNGEMARLEARLRRRGGLASGVIERAGRS